MWLGGGYLAPDRTSCGSIYSVICLRSFCKSSVCKEETTEKKACSKQFTRQSSAFFISTYFALVTLNFA